MNLGREIYVKITSTVQLVKNCKARLGRAAIPALNLGDLTVCKFQAGRSS